MSDAMLLLSCLTQSLAHELRTGLSVLNNELTYINTKLEDNDCGLALERCRRMADYLKQVTAIGGPRLQKTAHTLREFLYLSPIPAEGQFSGGDEVILEIDSARWGMALRNMLALFVTAFPDADKSLGYAVEADSVILKFQFNGAGGEELAAPTPKTLSEFFNIVHDRENVLAPLADAILLAHTATLRFVRDPGKLELHVSVPRQK